jgi:hypothetical protein
MRRSGILLQLPKRHWPPLITDMAEDIPTTVELATVEIIFIILAAGVFTSVLILIMEPLFQRLRHYKHTLGNATL